MDAVFEGFHATVFAYGETGSGKTHTIMGDTNEPGVCTIFGRELLAARAQCDEPVQIQVSYLQIYRKIVTDLVCAG